MLPAVVCLLVVACRKEPPAEVAAPVKRSQPAVKFELGRAGESAEVREALWAATHPDGLPAQTFPASPGQKFEVLARVFNRGGPGTGVEVLFGGPALEGEQVVVRSVELEGTGSRVEGVVSAMGPGRARVLFAQFPISAKADDDDKLNAYLLSPTPAEVEGDLPEFAGTELPPEVAAAAEGTAQNLTLRVRCELRGHLPAPAPLEVVVRAPGLPGSEARQRLLIIESPPAPGTDGGVTRSGVTP